MAQVDGNRVRSVLTQLKADVIDDPSLIDRARNEPHILLQERGLDQHEIEEAFRQTANHRALSLDGDVPPLATI